MVLSFFFA